MKTETGGPAFPLAFQEMDAQGNPQMAMYAHDGMTLRDYFAAKAMQSAIAGLLPGLSLLSLNSQDIAEFAYRQADAMLAERNRGTDEN